MHLALFVLEDWSITLTTVKPENLTEYESGSQMLLKADTDVLQVRRHLSLLAGLGSPHLSKVPSLHLMPFN